ncbi:hypothetical protein JCM10908_005599 [Rhodotorula pacifica]|uniref:uncharacterized protein n=1 Tax=Rhodotorula pacifica TaxID=1495444 RepID=UPI00316F2728
MHATLPTHVLALAPDSLAAIGQIDPDGLAELWAVFTRCKDSLQNGRRLENLSWRLWFDSGRRGPDLDDALAKQNGHAQPLVPEEWSDPEWEETSDSEVSASSSGGEELDEEDDEEAAPVAATDGAHVARAGRPALARKAATTGSTSVSPQSKVHARPRTASVPAAPTATAPNSAGSTAGGDAATGAERACRPTLGRRGFSREGRALHIISGNSLQRMIADLQRMPEIPPFGKARSLSDVPAANPPVKPSLGSRGSSAPDGLNSASRHASAPTSPTLPSTELDSSSRLRSRRTSSDVSPALSRANSSPAPASSSADVHAGSAEPPAPTPALHRRFPSNLAMSTLPRTRRSRPATPASSPPSREGADVPLTPSETAMLAVAESRNRSDVNLHKRTQSTADLAASFKPASYIKGFEPSPTSLARQPTPSVCLPASVDARPGPGAIAPPPTPANRSAALAPSPPRSGAVSLSPPTSRHPSRTPASSLVSPPSTKAPPPAPSSSVASAAPHSHQSNASAGPSAMQGRRKGPGASKKIFFISSPDSDEEHSSRSRSSEMRVVVTPPSAKRGAAAAAAVVAAEQQHKATSSSAGAAGAAAKAPATASKNGDDDDGWASDSDDDASSGWGSEYSTESDEPRPGARAGGRNQAFDAKTAFAKRAPSDLHRTASTATVSGSASNWGGGPGELKRPGLLSQLFHPDQFVKEPERKRSSMDLLRRQHQSSPALAMLGRQQSLHASGSTDGIDKRPTPKTARTKSFLKGKPDHVELESSSEEDDDDERQEAAARAAAQAEADAQRAAAVALARRQRELEEVVAPPQTPRTTRRAMLATELSESLRRNLLWERQTRNRVLGGQPPRRPMMPGEQLPPRPASSTNLVAQQPQQQQQEQQPAAPTPPPGVTRAQTDSSRAPQGSTAPPPPPAAASRRSPPLSGRIAGVDPPRERHAGTAALPRRHTTGTGLYLQAMTGGGFPGNRRGRGDATESDVSDSSDDDGGTASPADAFGSSAGQRVW